LAIITTVGICLLVVAGGVVRLTGSGLGCDDWPNCNDTSFIDVSSGHTAIEQVNRLLSGLIGIPTLLLVIQAFRVAPRGAGLRWPAVGVLVSVLANGVVGGLAVRGDLHPVLVQSHFLLAMVSIAFGMIAIHRSSDESRSTADVDRATAVVVLVLTGTTALALATGTVVTGTGPHAGDEDVRRFGFDIGTVARTHSLAVLLALVVASTLAWRVARRGRVTGRVDDLVSPLSTWIFVALIQGAVGYVQYFNGVPELLVGIHIAGATLMWVLTVRIALVTRAAAVLRPRITDRPIAFSTVDAA
jgi:cytochrome c oxidase assembly protein subunit 15